MEQLTTSDETPDKFSFKSGDVYFRRVSWSFLLSTRKEAYDSLAKFVIVLTDKYENVPRSPWVKGKICVLTSDGEIGWVNDLTLDVWVKIA